MLAIASMEAAINSMQTSATLNKYSESAGSSAAKYITPADQFSRTFETFLEAQKENPESKFRVQLTKMRNLGFTNTQKCIAALEESNGQAQPAIDLLLKQQART